jgi:hypothetical protein
LSRKLQAKMGGREGAPGIDKSTRVALMELENGQLPYPGLLKLRLMFGEVHAAGEILARKLGEEVWSSCIIVGQVLSHASSIPQEEGGGGPFSSSSFG